MGREIAKREGRRTNSDVTQISIPFTSSSMSISSSSPSAEACPFTAAPVPFVCFWAPPNRLSNAGAAARSLEYMDNIAPTQWWYSTGGPEKKESGVWDWCVERGVNEEVAGAEWRTSMVFACFETLIL